MISLTSTHDFPYPGIMDNLKAIKLKVVRTNRFGDKCYRELEEEKEENTQVTCDSNAGELNLYKIWTIEAPSDALCVLFKFWELEIRTYDNTTFLFSKKASEAIPEQGKMQGEIVVLETTELNGADYFIIVGDNKNYLMNPGGGKCSDEFQEYNSGKCGIREVKEELGISLQLGQLKPIGCFTYSQRNELCGKDFVDNGLTTVFYAKINHMDTAHLFSHSSDSHRRITKLDIVSKEPICLYDIKSKFGEDQFYCLNETEMICFIPKMFLDDAPTEINNKKFDNHHREILRICAGIPREKPQGFPWLNTFDVKW